MITILTNTELSIPQKYSIKHYSSYDAKLINDSYTPVVLSQSYEELSRFPSSVLKILISDDLYPPMDNLYIIQSISQLSDVLDYLIL